MAPLASAFERAITRAVLGRADLAIVLAESLRHDAAFLTARRIAVVPNGIVDPGPPPPRPGPRQPWRALFLGLCSEEKGVFLAAEAVIEANRRAGTPPDAPAFTLVAAGAFPDDASEVRFAALGATHPAAIRHAGFLTGAEKTRILGASDCLLFPSHYPAEGQPLAVIEALAHDLPVIATRWRALPELVTAEVGRIVPVGDCSALADALIAVRSSPPPGSAREHFQRRFQLSQHLATLAGALQRVESPEVISRNT